MSSPQRSMRTPLGRVRAYGASGQGTGTFIGQRVSAAALVILGLWFLISVVLQMHGPGFVDSIDFLTSPLNAVGVILLVVAAFYHMRIGMKEVIEDYIQKHSTKTLLLLLNTLVLIALGVGAIFAVLIVNFGA
ncbi:MAG: succinate dehydrogenase, hydrophobic membrane anchor protein [Proteobacteria bacterium]|nr:succinate dehydrogenase, hydrophobic membrane anchor protein [Pseudomonadota bacterium]